MTLTIHVREEVFHFISMEDWIHHAYSRYRNHGHTSETTIAVDQKGIVVCRSKQFEHAAYPVRVYAIDDAPYEPMGVLGKRRPATVEEAKAKGAADYKRVTGQETE